MRFRQQSFQQRCFLLPLISDWMMVFIINTLIFQTVIKIHLCFQPFHVHGSFQRHVYLQKGTPMAVLFKFQLKKSYRNWNSVVGKVLSRVQLKLCMSVCVCLNGWHCVRMLAMHVLLWLNKALWFLFLCEMEKWISVEEPWARSVCFVCLWRVESEEQISVSYHLSLMFSQQYSVTSICSGFNGESVHSGHFLP